MKNFRGTCAGIQGALNIRVGVDGEDFAEERVDCGYWVCRIKWHCERSAGVRLVVFSCILHLRSLK
jgi:hypothetical protein